MEIRGHVNPERGRPMLHRRSWWMWAEVRPLDWFRLWGDWQIPSTESSWMSLCFASWFDRSTNWTFELMGWETHIWNYAPLKLQLNTSIQWKTRRYCGKFKKIELPSNEYIAWSNKYQVPYILSHYRHLGTGTFNKFRKQLERVGHSRVGNFSSKGEHP